jgi:hypothetical protein
MKMSDKAKSLINEEIIENSTKLSQQSIDSLVEKLLVKFHVYLPNELVDKFNDINNNSNDLTKTSVYLNVELTNIMVQSKMYEMAVEK